MEDAVLGCVTALPVLVFRFPGRLRQSGSSTIDTVIHQLEWRSLLTAVTATTPTNSTQPVSASGNITVTFDVAMNASTLRRATLQLVDSNDAVVPASVTYTSATRTATMDPTANLAVTANYYFVECRGRDRWCQRFQRQRHVVGLPSTSFATSAPTFNEQTVFSGLNNPTAIEFASDGRIFIAEKRGIIKEFDSFADTAPPSSRTFAPRFTITGIAGCLGWRIDPQFPTRPYIYVLYTYDATIGGTAPVWGSVGGDSDSGPDTTGNAPAVSARLSKLTISGNTMTNEQVLINDWAQQYPSHSIGHLQFGPDGNLYASAGDSLTFQRGGLRAEEHHRRSHQRRRCALRSQDILSSGDATKSYRWHDHPHQS